MGAAQRFGGDSAVFAWRGRFAGSELVLRVDFDLDTQLVLAKLMGEVSDAARGRSAFSCRQDVRAVLVCGNHGGGRNVESGGVGGRVPRRLVEGEVAKHRHGGREAMVYRVESRRIGYCRGWCGWEGVRVWRWIEEGEVSVCECVMGWMDG